MKIGIDVRRLTPDDSSGLTAWLHGALTALLTADPDNTYVLFTTVFNYHQFGGPWPNAVRHTLPAPGYGEQLADRLVYEGDFDLLVRAGPDAPVDRFPLGRQVVCLTDWPEPACPEQLDPGARAARRALRAYQCGAGALVVPTEALRDRVAADPWTTVADVLVAPAGSPADAAAALRAALDRVAARAAAGRPAVRVYTPPVVSVVTPSYNQGAFIRQTIDSVLTQDYPHIDYRVVDGGSTDETVAVLKSYGDRVKWTSEPDRGQTHAINKGLDRATGEVFAYLNSDDLLRPGAVARAVDHFRARPACDLVYGRDALIDARGSFLGMYPTADYSFERLVGRCCVSQPAAFWRRRIADRVGPFDESLKLVMDYDYWLRVDRAGGVLEHIPDVLAHTRIHRDAKSSGGGTAAAHARAFYHEVFAVSFRHAGYVSSDYVHLWLYTLLNRHPWARRYKDHLVYLAQHWYHRRYRTRQALWPLLWDVFRDRPRGLSRVVGGHLLEQLGPLDPRRLWRRRRTPPVPLEPDLWLEPEVTVAHAGGPLRLTGVPARDAVLRVFRGADEVAAFPLRAGETADLCADVPPDPKGAPLRLVFSDAEPLPDGRTVAFRLLGTTLFTERDVA